MIVNEQSCITVLIDSECLDEAKVVAGPRGVESLTVGAGGKPLTIPGTVTIVCQLEHQPEEEDKKDKQQDHSKGHEIFCI